MKAKKTSLPRLVFVPETIPEANDLLVKLGQYERELAAIALNLEASVAEAKKVAEAAAEPLETIHAATVKALEKFATRERKALLLDSKKSVVLLGGEFGWRTTPSKVTIAKAAAGDIVDNLKALGLTRYLRVTTEVDREALLKDRPAIAGVRYTQSEKFYVKPNTERAPDGLIGERLKNT